MGDCRLGESSYPPHLRQAGYGRAAASSIHDARKPLGGIMKVLLVYPNVVHTMSPQMGLLSLGSFLREKGIDVQFCDLSFTPNRRYRDHLVSEIERWRPDIVGVSCRTLESPIAKVLCAEVKQKFPHILLICGGPHMTLKPEDILPLVDFGVIGEGEETLYDIAMVFASGRRSSIAELPNIAFLHNSQVERRPLRPLIDLETLPMPYWPLLDERHYTDHQCLPMKPGARVCGTFEGSRGCPYQCTYCNNAALMKSYKGLGTWRREKAATRLRQEILSFRAVYGLDLAFYSDEVIMTSDARTAEYRQHLSDLDLPFIFMDRPDLATETRVADMKAAGAFFCALGIESANEEYRRRLLGRQMKDKVLFDAYATMKAYGIRTHCFTIMGLPGQTKETMRATFELVRDLQPYSAQSSIFFPLPGTALEEVCREEKLLTGKVPVHLYDLSTLSFDDDRKRWIETYSKLINMGAWKKSVRSLILEFVGMRWLSVLEWLERWAAFRTVVGQKGVWATIRKVAAKLTERLAIRAARG